jgi:hypothetical protein
MVIKYNQFKPLWEEIAGGFPFAGKPLGRGGAWRAWLSALGCGGVVALLVGGLRLLAAVLGINGVASSGKI